VRFFCVEIDGAGKGEAVSADVRLFPPVTAGQDQRIKDLKLVAEIIPDGLPFKVHRAKLPGPLPGCVTVHLEGFPVIIDAGRQFVGTPENGLFQDVFRG